MTVAEAAIEPDWSRLAWPQPDGYDTAEIAALAAARNPRWRRRPAEGGPALFDGQVAVRNRPSGGLPSPRYAAADPEDPALAAGEALLRLWPEAAAQFAALVDTIQPWTDTAIPASARAYPGSTSDSLEAEFGTIMLTCDNGFGVAQAMVHEMAHHKLRALGVSLLSADRIVANDPGELYTSPIVVGRKRPMTAVLHAQYAFMHVTALDLAVYLASERGSPARADALFLLARNLPRMEAGHAEIGRHLRTDEAGGAFAPAFRAWSEQVLGEGRAILDAEGYGMPPL